MKKKTNKKKQIKKKKKYINSKLSRYNIKFTKILGQLWMRNFAAL